MKHYRLLIAGLALGLTTAGCGHEETANTPTPSQPAPKPAPAGNAPTASASAIAQADMDKVTSAKDAPKMTLIVKTRNNPFFDPMIKGAEGEAKSLGAELKTEAPAQETDKERQFSMVEDVTARGVKAILIAPADSKGIVPALKKATEKGVLVINLDNQIDPATASSAGLELGGYVGADNEEGGKLAGKAMLEALKEKGKVAILEGIRGADNAEKRKHGFESAVEGKLEIAARESAEWDTQKAYAKTQSLLAAHPDLAGIFCANDKMALGAIKAISEAGKKGKITVVGYDNIPDVKPYLSSGELYATIEQHPDLMGKYGVKMAAGVLDGSIPKGKQFLVPLEVIKGTSK